MNRTLLLILAVLASAPVALAQYGDSGGVAAPMPTDTTDTNTGGVAQESVAAGWSATTIILVIVIAVVAVALVAALARRRRAP